MAVAVFFLEGHHPSDIDGRQKPQRIYSHIITFAPPVFVAGGCKLLLRLAGGVIQSNTAHSPPFPHFLVLSALPGIFQDFVIPIRFFHPEPKGKKINIPFPSAPPTLFPRTLLFPARKSRE